jgi:hypothetical protein
LRSGGFPRCWVRESTKEPDLFVGGASNNLAANIIFCFAVAVLADKDLERRHQIDGLQVVPSALMPETTDRCDRL